MGREDLVDINQVADYIVSNFVDSNGEPLRQAAALALCSQEQPWEWIQNGVANRSFVYYIGDMIADRAQLDEIDDSEYGDDDEDTFVDLGLEAITKEDIPPDDEAG